MSFLSGFFMALAFGLAVVFGGQTLDFTWGPGLVALGLALWMAGGSAGSLRERGWPAWGVVAVVLAATGWIFWRCAGSPVAEFARADALLVGAMLASFVWAVLIRPESAGYRVLFAGLALLCLVNLALALAQKTNPEFSGLFPYRPGRFPSGLFGHYNHLADFSLVAAVLLAGRALLGGDRWWERVIQGSGGLAALVCVTLSGSRGGMLSLCIALLVLTAGILAASWRCRSKAFRPLCFLAVLMPVLVGAAAAPVLQEFQERRGRDGEIVEMADNRFRLGMIGLALDLTEEHPWAGGGSRSFAWEKNPAWDLSRNRRVSNDDFVHNGAMQLAVEYGWIGVILVGGSLFFCGVTGFTGLVAGEREGSRKRNAGDALVCGGLAAMVGTVFHSNFSFVHHTLPGAMYLGLAMGACLSWVRVDLADRFGRSGRWWVAAAMALLLAPAAALVWNGYRGTLAYRTAWPVMFAESGMVALAPEISVDRLDTAYEYWPCAVFPARAARICRFVAEQAGIEEAEGREWLARGIALYAVAGTSQPFDPEWPINRGNLLSALGEAEAADREFRRGIVMQGRMEGGFRARYFLAAHLYREGYRLWTRERRAGKALAMFLEAGELLVEAEKDSIGANRTAARELARKLDESILFLEGAGIRPEGDPAVAE